MDAWGNALSEIDSNGMEQPLLRHHGSGMGYLLSSLGDDASCRALVDALSGIGVHGSFLLIRAGEVWLRAGAPEHLAALVRAACRVWVAGHLHGLREASRMVAAH